MAHKPKSTRQDFKKRIDHVAKMGDVAKLSDMAARHYAKDRPTRREVQMMIDASIASPWAILGAWFRSSLRFVTGARKRLERELAAEQAKLEQREEEIIDDLTPAELEALAAEADEGEDAPKQIGIPAAPVATLPFKVVSGPLSGPSLIERVSR